MSATHHVYALFDRPEDADAAYLEVQESGCSGEHCSAVLHAQHIDESGLRSSERAGREGAAKGAAVAGTAGAVLGGLAALGGGLLGVGPLAAIAITGGVMASFGALAGGLAWSDDPERHIRAIETEVAKGSVLIAVQVDDRELEHMCEDIFRRHGGRTVAA